MTTTDHHSYTHAGAPIHVYTPDRQIKSSVNAAYHYLNQYQGEILPDAARDN